MSLVSAVGYSNEINAREAAQQAAQQALKGLRSASPKLGLVFFSHLFDAAEVRHGLAGLLGEIPLWGASTSAIYAGRQPCRVVVVVLGGPFAMDTTWLGHYGRDPFGSALELNARLEHLKTTPHWHSVLLAADGVNGDIGTLLSSFEQAPIRLGGFLSGAGFPRGKNCLLGETYCAAGGLSAAWFGPGIRLGMAAASGWKDSGMTFLVTASRENRLIQLDGQPAAGTLGQALGYSPAEWNRPPLFEVVRLFPLGYRDESSGETVLAAPLAVQEDGSLLMNVLPPEGSRVRLMVAERSACLQSLQDAIQTAKAGLVNQEGGVGMFLLDSGWFELFRTQENTLLDAMHSAAGQMPWFSVATLGHIYRKGEQISPLATNLGALAVVFGDEGQNAG
ncbi:MAG: FIST N-terminal domain-containing protein [Chloroflexota bacterium]